MRRSTAKLSTLRAGAKSLQGTTFYEPGLLDLVVPRRERPDVDRLTEQVADLVAAGEEPLPHRDAGHRDGLGHDHRWHQGHLEREAEQRRVGTAGGSGPRPHADGHIRVRRSATPSVDGAGAVVGALLRPGFCPDRLAGADRYATAVAVARSANPSATTVVLANGTDAGMADALVAAPLAKARSGACSLTTPDGPAPPRCTPRSPAARQDGAPRRQRRRDLREVETQLKGLGITGITRYSGRDRYATAAAVLGGGPPARRDGLQRRRDG